MKFETINEGFVTRRQANSATASSGSPRCVLTTDGELVCTYVVQKSSGLNDFKPTLARSKDNGVSWSEDGFIWPHLQDKYSICGSISRAPNGEFFFYGTRAVIDTPGELCWSDATLGLKQNELIWARSTDNGLTWTEPAVIPMPIPGSAEAPGAMCITRSGTWLCCYAPYNTFDPKVIVDRNQVIVMRSEDQGKTWSHTSMLRFDDVNSGGAEAWVIELIDGRLLGTSWHINYSEDDDYPNAYSVSLDGGLTWQPTRSTGIMGQSTALAPLPDSRALFIYNQRRESPIGIWLALVNPTESDFGIEANEIIWRAQTGTRSNLEGTHSEWTDFSFGEPSITILPDNTLLAVLWCIQPAGRGIYYVKLRMQNDK